MTSLQSLKFNLVCVAIGLLAGPLARADEAAAPSDNAWHFTVGLGAASQPRYPGSAERKSSGFPVLSATYGRYFIGGVPGAGVPAGIGAYLVQNDHWRVGVGLGGSFEKPRQETDSPRLRGLGDIDRTALGAVFASYSDTWWTLRGNVLTDIGGKQQGTRLSLGAEARYPVSDTITLSAGPNVTWADAKYTQTFFGVDAAQSARSGLAVRTAKAGLNSVGFSVGANVRLSSNWGVGVFASTNRLRGDAADSPVTEKVSQSQAGLFAAYTF
jgi:outer membrane protein